MKKLITFSLVALAMSVLLGILSFAAPVTKSEDGLTIEVDFSAMAETGGVKGAVTAESIGAIDVDDNYQIKVNDGVVLMTIDGYNPAWAVYKLAAPEGQLLDTARITIGGRIWDYAPNANAFAVFAKATSFSGSGNECELNMIEAQNRGTGDWEDYAVTVQQAQHNTMNTNDNIDSVLSVDLTAAAKGNAELYVAIFQLTTGSPEWIELKSLKLEATAVAKQTEGGEGGSDPVNPGDQRDPDNPGGNTPSPSEPNVNTGDAAVTVFAIIVSLALCVAVFARRRSFC